MDRKSFLVSIVAAAASSSVGAGCKRARSEVAASPDSRKAGQLLDRLIEHTNAAYFIAAAYIGDRLGLFRAMAGEVPLSAKQLAAKTGLNERYVLEWLRSMAAARYIDHHPESDRFSIPPEHVAILVDENAPDFCAGIIEAVVPDMLMVPRVIAACRSGRGIPYGDYPTETFEAIDRFTRPDYLHRLTQRWLPCIPGVAERLRAGGTAADLGSGAGYASIAIANAFPKVRAFGFEPYAPSVSRARENARAAGLAGRVSFDVFDGVHVPGGPYDLITVNHSLHHAGDPAALLSAARQALAKSGVLLVVEERRSARLEDDIASPRAGYYAIGLLECLPTALAEGAPGYGTGITEPDMRTLARVAGFREVSRVMPDDPLLSFFVMRA